MAEFGSQDPGSWGWPRGDDADIIPFSFGGHSFPAGCARLAAPVFTAALTRIVAQPGFALNESTGLDAGMWGYENRRKGSGGGWSFHAYGLALDVNAPWNPMAAATPPAGRYRLPMNTMDLVRPLGILWGADFGDWMHLEVHLSRGEAEAAQGGLQPPSERRSFPLPVGWYYGPYEGPRESISGSGKGDAAYRPGLIRAQMALGLMGGAADGYYGPVTAAAARAWQSSHGLVADGLIGPKTWASLGL